MKKFELCYRLDAKSVLVPDLLAVEESTFNFDYDTSLRFIIEYDFLPRSVMPRFIVRRHRDIKNKLQWRTGVVLEEEDYESTAVVKCDELERRIFIYVNGKQKRDYFSVIRKTFRDIINSFEKLKTVELVPLPDNHEISIEYEELIGYELGMKTEIYIGKLGKGYSVAQLLAGIEKPAERVKMEHLEHRPVSDPSQYLPEPGPGKKDLPSKKMKEIITYLGIILGIMAAIVAIIEFLS